MLHRPIRRAGALLGLAVIALIAPRSMASDPATTTSASAPSAAEFRLRADVTYLADDLREGRAPGTAGIDAAADYIAGVFRELGLKTAPGADGYFQPFTIKGSAALAGDQSLSLKAKDKDFTAKPKADFTALALGSSANVQGLPVVFAGYGITAKEADDKVDYDDYAGLDVKGKAVLIIRREPKQDDPKSPFKARGVNRLSDLRRKLTNAADHGAKAVILVNDAKTAPDKAHDHLLPFGYAGGEQDQTAAIPFAMITRELTDQVLAAAGAPRLAEAEKVIDADLKPQSQPLDGVTLSEKYTIERKALVAKNVIGVLEGSGPHADETIVVGGHYDHLGHGGLFSGSLAMFSRDIHNGADDNASGTAMVLEMARRLARRPDPLPRRVVFMAFSGEEKGLLGSLHYVGNPLYPLAKTVFMINFDMVGRLNEEDELTLFGTGSTPGAAELVDALGASAGFKIKKVKGISDGIGGSDHESFYMAGVPVLFAFTGVHSDYHKPSDDTHRINFRGMARIADFGELLLLDLVRRPKRPELLKVGTQVAAHGGEKPKEKPSDNPHETKAGDDTSKVTITAYFGSMPDYGADVKGVKLAGVTDGSPAEKAGLKRGDVVVNFGGKPVATVQDYTRALADFKPGDPVDVKIQRDGKDVTLKATLGSRPRGN